MTNFISIIFLLFSAGISAAHGADDQHSNTAASTEVETVFNCNEQSESDRHCSPVFACIGIDGEFFQGRARGRGDIGLVRGRLGSGAHCSGFWQRDTASGAGQSKLNCSNGVRAEVSWDSRQQDSGYFVGTGQDSQDRKVLFWVGQSYIDRIQSENLDPHGFCASYLQEEGLDEEGLDLGVKAEAVRFRSD